MDLGLPDPQAPQDMHHFIDVYGDTMQQKHTSCQNCCVLIQIGDVYQCGIILSCGDRFCFILTTKISMLRSTSVDFVVTFGDAIERNFNASNVIVQSSNKLSILLLCDGIETVPAKQQVHFSTQKNIEEAVVYKLSYIPKASYKHQGCLIQCAAANSCFRGGQLGIVDRQYDGVDIFYHNCCAGTDITSGSAVLNGRREIVGLNLVYSTGWTMALHLSAIKDAIVEIFPDIQDKTFAGIQEYLKAKDEVEANKANN